MKVLVIGAGVAGGVIAGALAKLGTEDVVVVDRVSSDEHLYAGNGLNIGPNCLLALDAFLPEVAQELRTASLPWKSWRGSTIGGELLYEIPLERVARATGLRIRWSELYRIAQADITKQTMFRTEIRRLRRNPDTTWTVVVRNLDDESEQEIARVDLIVACDGRYSATRRALIGDHVTRHLGVSNFRLLVEDRGRLDIDDMEEWYADACRILAFRVRDGRIYVSGNLPIQPGLDIPELYKSEDGLRRAFFDGRTQLAPVCESLVEQACQRVSELHWARAQEIPTCFHDRTKTVVFVGDSAHAMVPTLGQGATQALEDAAVFVRTFSKLRGRGAVAIATSFAAVRAARVQHARDFSWTASACLLSGSDPYVQSAKKKSDEYLNNLRVLYDFDPSFVDNIIDDITGEVRPSTSDFRLFA